MFPVFMLPVYPVCTPSVPLPPGEGWRRYNRGLGEGKGDN